MGEYSDQIKSSEGSNIKEDENNTSVLSDEDGDESNVSCEGFDAERLLERGDDGTGEPGFDDWVEASTEFAGLEAAFKTTKKVSTCFRSRHISERRASIVYKSSKRDSEELSWIKAE